MNQDNSEEIFIKYGTKGTCWIQIFAKTKYNIIHEKYQHEPKGQLAT